jgi:hypothetical protein
MVPFKPHSVTVSSPVSQQGEVPDQESNGTVSCMMAPEKASTVFERFAVEVVSPYVLYAEMTDAALFEIGGQVAWQGKDFEIVAMQEWDHGLPADHIEVALRKVNP